MIRGLGEVLKQLIESTHQLETDGDDEIRFSNNWASSRTVWRPVNGDDYQIRFSNNWPSPRTSWNHKEDEIEW